MKIAVTGGSGQLGTHVLRRLLADRRIKEVRCLDLRPPLVPPGRRLSYHRVDVRDADLAAHFEGMDAVIHLAFIIVARMPRPELDAINVGGSKNVFESAIRAGVRRFVYTSSIAAYGVVPGHPVPIVESTPRRRDEGLPYAASKYDVELWLDELEARHSDLGDLTIARVRPGMLVGDRMEHPMGTLLRLGLLPDGGMEIPVVWDEDVADAVAAALGKQGAFNLVASDQLPSRELARAVGLRPLKSRPRLARLAVAGTRFLGRPVDPSWVKHRPTVTMIASTEKARAELGWRPRHPTTLDVFKQLRAVAPRRMDPSLQIFFALVGAASRAAPPNEEARHVTARIHLELGGPGGGDVTIAVDAGRVRISRGAPRPPTSSIRLHAGTFLALLAGATDVSTAQLTGKILIEGDPIAGMIFSGMVNTFRASSAWSGPAGFVIGRLARWFTSRPPEVP